MRPLLNTCLVLVALTAVGLVLDDPAPRCARAEEGGAPAFAGADSCKRCHFKQFRSWKKSAFAKAYTHLQPGEAAEAKTAAGLDPATDFTQDAKCLQCHVTAYGKEGGHPEVGAEWSAEEQERAKILQGVQCESCHGPGSEYGPYKAEHEDYKRADLVELGAVIPVTAESCAPCHVKECPTMPEDYAFDPAVEVERMRKEDTAHDHVPLKHEH